MSTELTVTQRAIVALGQAGREDDLKALASRTTSIKTITNKAGYDQVHASRMALKGVRLDLQRLGKAARDDATKFSKAVIAEENRLISLVEVEEKRLEAIQWKYDADIEAAKQAAIDAENRRVAELTERVEELRGPHYLTASSGSVLIAHHISDLEAIPVDGSFQELRQQAFDAKAGGLARLRELHTAAVAHETEQARIKAEREELARLRKAEEERQAAERARLAEEEREARAAREAEAAKQAEELRKQREAQEAETTRIRAEQEAAARAERERIAEENKRLAAERADFQRQQDEARRKREEEERQAAEQARVAAIRRPKDAEIVAVLAKHYRAPETKVIEWLSDANWKKALAA
jgi:hypothetical protein